MALADDPDTEEPVSSASVDEAVSNLDQNLDPLDDGLLENLVLAVLG